MPARGSVLAVVAAALLVALGGALSSPPPARPQSAHVWLNIYGRPGQKINIAIPDFTVLSGADAQWLAKRLPEVVSMDLTFSALFAVGSGTAALPANNPAALREALAGFAAGGAHAALQGLLTLQGDRAQVARRLHDLTSPGQPMIGSKKLEMPLT